MNILVTGGAGYIGSHTAKALKQAGHTVAVFDSFENGHRACLAELIEAKNIFEGNLLDTDALESAFVSQKFDAVIHFGAYIEAGESVKDPGRFFWNNTAGSINLFNAMLKHSVYRLVFSSTAAVYGEPKSVPINENALTKPTNPYGTSKLAVENILNDLTKFTPLRATILRYFNACGADPEGSLGEYHPNETHLIPLILQVPLGKRDKIKIFGTDYPTPDGTCIRDYVHVSDLSQAHVIALEKQSDNLAIYNVGTGQGYSVKTIIETCQKVTGQTILTSEESRRAGDPAELVADATKIKQELGWQPRYSNIETIIETAWRWQKSHPDGYRD